MAARALAAPPRTYIPHDQRFKILMRHPWMIWHLIVGFLPLRWPRTWQPGRLQPWPQEWITPDLSRRQGDMVWLLRDRRGHPLCALLLECQSEYDATMELRLAHYQLLLARALRRHNVKTGRGRPAPLLSLVFHVGPRPWPGPWLTFASAPGMSPAVVCQPGLTLDIHTYADREPPPHNLVSCMIMLELGRYRWAREPNAISELARLVREDLEPLLRHGPDELAQDFAAYVKSGLDETVSGLNWTADAFHSIHAVGQNMVTLAEHYRMTHETGHRKGHQEGRQEERLAMLVESARLLWDAETSRRLRERLPALAFEAWPSLRDLHTAAQERRDPMQMVDALRARAP